MIKKRNGHVRNVVDNLITRWEKGAARKSGAVQEAWEKAAGEKADGHSQPVSFKKGVLVVVVENSAWLYELTLIKRSLLDKFNRYYTGRSRATGIRFRVGVVE